MKEKKSNGREGIRLERERERETKKVTFAPFSDSEYSNPPAECERGKWLGRRKREREKGDHDHREPP